MLENLQHVLRLEQQGVVGGRVGLVGAKEHGIIWQLNFPLQTSWLRELQHSRAVGEVEALEVAGCGAPS